jgi:hypothetical protein
MVRNRKLVCLTAAGLTALLVLAIGTARPVRAADPIFPTGSRVGLVPPPGMVPAEAFDGFADPGKDAAILIAVLPPTAYSQIEKSMDPDALKKQGVNVEKREPMQVSLGKAFLLVGSQTADKVRYRKWLLVASASDFTALVSVQVPEDDPAYPDSVIRAALATVAARAQVPQSEQLSLLPFAVSDLAGFHVDGVLRGRALLLSDSAGGSSAPQDSSKDASSSDASNASNGAARFFVAAIPGGPQEASQHPEFARLAFNEIGGIKEVQVSMSEPLRINGQSGYQMMAQAKDARSGADVMVVQWLRFGSGGYLQMVGIAPTGDKWTGMLARFRTVRDSIDTK